MGWARGHARHSEGVRTADRGSPCRNGEASFKRYHPRDIERINPHILK